MGELNRLETAKMMDINRKMELKKLINRYTVWPRDME